jgi:hypothetical protein
MARQVGIILLVVYILDVRTIRIPWIDNVSLIDIHESNIETQTNLSSQECLCSAMKMNSMAINYYTRNRTCDLFAQFPINYRLDPTRNARLYFPQGKFPNASYCCMPDWNQRYVKLITATKKSVNVNKPRCLVIDNHGYLVTVEDHGNYLNRFEALNLTLIDRTLISNVGSMNLVYHREKFFISQDDNTILIIDSNNLTTIKTISSLEIYDPRDIIFLRDGQLMIVASAGNNCLVFFNRSASSHNNYTFISKQVTPFSEPHGIWYVNDSFFYVTSWSENTIYSYAFNAGASWTVNLIIETLPLTFAGSGSHLFIDECQRSWFSINNYGIFIHDYRRRPLGILTVTAGGAFDSLLVNNYILYVADNIVGKIIRLDPHITC